MTTQRTVTDADLVTWLALAQAQLDEHLTQYPSQSEELSFMRGPKYARIVKTCTRGGEGRSVYVFVELATGDILKPDGWKRPAKGVRGNIFAERPLGGTTSTGAVYFR